MRAIIESDTSWAPCTGMTHEEWTCSHQARANTRWVHWGCSCTRATPNMVFSKIIDSKRRHGTPSANKHDSSHMDSLDAFHSQNCSRAASGFVFHFSIRDISLKVWERLIVFHKCQGITYIRAAGVARRPTARAQLHPQSRPNYISLTLVSLAQRGTLEEIVLSNE
jgi:hypothetical protein